MEKIFIRLTGADSGETILVSAMCIECIFFEDGATIIFTASGRKLRVKETPDQIFEEVERHITEGYL